MKSTGGQGIVLLQKLYPRLRLAILSQVSRQEFEVVVHISPPQTPSRKTTVQDKHYKVGPSFKNIFSLSLSVCSRHCF